MSLVIPQNYIEDMEGFDFSEWRATMITREKRTKGDFFFAQIVKFYGINDETDEYDLGNKKADFAYLGRIPKAVGDSDWSKDPKKSGVREYEPPKFDEVENQVTKEVTRELAKGRLIWKYTLAATPENIANLKKLVGETGNESSTGFQIISESRPPISVTEDEIFSMTVKEFLKSSTMYNLEAQKREQSVKANELSKKMDNAKNTK